MKENTDVWIADEQTYLQLQDLKQFVRFVASLEITTDLEKSEADKILYLIENINNPETHLNFLVQINIFDFDLQSGLDKNGGVYWRKWSFSYENKLLEIVAETKHTDFGTEHFGLDFSYYGGIFFQKKIEFDQIYSIDKLHLFVTDAMNYQNYIFGNLKDIEIDIQVY